MKRKHWWMLGIGVVLIVGLISTYSIFKKKETPIVAHAATVPVQRGNLEVLVSGKGSVSPTSQKTVLSDVTGTVKRVLEEGDQVKKGDVIVELEGQDLSDKITAQQVALQKQELDMKDLEKRIKNAIDEDTRNSLLLSMQKQQLDIRTTRNQIAELEKEQYPEPIVSPVDGTIVSVSVNPGDEISTKKEVARIANYEVLQMVASIDELDIPKVEVGQKARISVDALSDQTFTGEVTKIANEGSPTNGVATFDVTIKLGEAKGVKAGMSAEASIEVQRKSNVLYLPIDAVQTFQNQFFVVLPEAEGEGESSHRDRAIRSGDGEHSGAEGEGGADGQSGATRQGGGAGQDAGRGDAGRQGSADGQSGATRQGGADGQSGATRQGGGAGQDAGRGEATRRGGAGQDAGRGDAGRQGSADGQSGATRQGGADGQSGATRRGGAGQGVATQGQGVLVGRGGGSAAANSRAISGTRKQVEVGIHNEDYIEIVSGLNEGDLVVLPITVTNSSGGIQMRIPGGGFGGGFSGGGGNVVTFPSGGATFRGGGR